MTDEEAIEELKMDVALYDNDIVRMKEFKDTPDAILIHALEMGINALEKQIPKTPINGIYCPECGWLTVGRWHKYYYCPHCGQAIDWSEMTGEENES